MSLTMANMAASRARVNSGHTAGCRHGRIHSARGVVILWGAPRRVNLRLSRSPPLPCTQGRGLTVRGSGHLAAGDVAGAEHQHKRLGHVAPDSVVAWPPTV